MLNTHVWTDIIYNELNKELFIAAINHKFLEAEEYWTCKICEISNICTFIKLLCSLIVWDIHFSQTFKRVFK